MKVVVGGGWTTVTVTPLSSPFWWEIYPVQAQKYCYQPTYISEPSSIHGQSERHPHNDLVNNTILAVIVMLLSIDDNLLLIDPHFCSVPRTGWLLYHWGRLAD